VIPGRVKDANPESQRPELSARNPWIPDVHCTSEVCPSDDPRMTALPLNLAARRRDQPRDFADIGIKKTR
jgi:hypothetical protein